MSIYNPNKKQWTEEDVIKLLSLINTVDTASLDAEIKFDDTHGDVGYLRDIIEDPNPGPDKIYELKDRDSRLRKYLQTLSPREELVIKLRYGLDDGNPKTLEEIGARFGVTKERIRQVERKAMKKLRLGLMFKQGIKKVEDF
jgi:RNA polymerase sigma factor (sigma-70 family)